MLIAIYYMLRDNTDFIDFDASFYNQFNTEKKINSYLKKLKELGYDISEETHKLIPKTI